MSRLSDEPLGAAGIRGYGRRLRGGQTSAVQTVRSYLDRIEKLNPMLHAYVHVDGEAALKAAQGIDALLASGTDLGPLMGVPIAVKDVIKVRGMPTRVGSDADVEDLVGEEGGFIRQLRRAGCIILGKTQTVEFAVGSAGTNYRRGTPRNPCDKANFRVPGGSSSGSAVAVAAGLCALAVGTDTGGSVRGPAAFCGVYGLKFGRDSVPDDGMFSMSKSIDSIGLLAPNAGYAAIAWGALTGQEIPVVHLSTLRLGRPESYFFDKLAPEMAGTVEAAIAALTGAGARIVPMDIAALRETDKLYTAIARPEVLTTLGSERFTAMRDQLNPDVAGRIAAGLGVSAEDYLASQRRRADLRQVVHCSFAEIDAWVAPVKQHFAPLYPGAFPSPQAEEEMEGQCYGPTRPANLFDLCGSSQPIGQGNSVLPAGLQLLRPSGDEARLLGIALACETVLGSNAAPDMSAWLDA